MRYWLAIASLWLMLISPPVAADHAHALLELGNGEIIPRYLLQAPNGQAITQEDFRGRFQLLSFGYTFCPDICPTTLIEMAAILKTLGERAGRLQPIFISVDPERDTPAQLKTYTAFFDQRILGLTGSPALVQRAAQNFKIRYAKVYPTGSEQTHYSVDHSAGMILLGPDGEFLHKYSYGKAAGEIAEDIATLIEQAPAVRR